MIEQEETYSNDALGYYRILGVSADTDDVQLKIKYRERAKLWHPDHNSSDDAKENFQKLSVAYDVISNDEKRLMYDILCSAYPVKSLPPLFSLKPYRNMEGKDDLGLQALSLVTVTGKIIKEEIKEEDKICNYREALSLALKTSCHNWIMGWWSIKAFAKNIQALIMNIKKVGNNRKKNYRLWAHNAIAYWQKKQLGNAYVSGAIAGQYANDAQKKLLKKLLSRLGVQPQFKVSNWHFGVLRLIQTIIPLSIILIMLLPFMGKMVIEADLWQYFQKENKIVYNQEVQLRSGDSIVDDMVVGKIIKIPVDLTDMSRLYHLKEARKIMYGPSEEFDVLKKLPAGTTVRVTGITPDETWYRIMLDEGEMGFVKKEDLASGIGNDIPYGSKIYAK